MFSNLVRISRATSQTHLISTRHLSQACNQSVDKLNGILEQYRTSHYSQEYPNRFRKDIVKAACSGTSSGTVVSAEGIECILRNIGAGDQMSRTEIESMLREVGSVGSEDPCVISADEMLNLLSSRSGVAN